MHVVVGKLVHAEVVGALADRSDHAVGTDGCIRMCDDRHDAMTRLIERRAHEIVHAGVDHDPTTRLGDLALDDAREQHAVRAHERATRLTIEREISEAHLVLELARRTDEIGGVDQTTLAVVDPEAAAGIDERERKARAHLARECEERARRGEIAVGGGELRADVRADADEPNLRRVRDEVERGRHARER